MSVLVAFSVGEMIDHFAYRKSKQSQETFIIKLQCVRNCQFRTVHSPRVKQQTRKLHTTFCVTVTRMWRFKLNQRIQQSMNPW